MSANAPLTSFQSCATGPAFTSLTSMNVSAICPSAPASPLVSQVRYCA